MQINLWRQHGIEPIPFIARLWIKVWPLFPSFMQSKEKSQISIKRFQKQYDVFEMISENK